MGKILPELARVIVETMIVVFLDDNKFASSADFNRFTFHPTPFYNHVFVGSRFALNDVQSADLLVGGVISLDNGSTFFNVEGSRRVGDRFKVSIENCGFVKLESDDVFYGFRNGSYSGATLDWFFKD